MRAQPGDDPSRAAGTPLAVVPGMPPAASLLHRAVALAIAAAASHGAAPAHADELGLYNELTVGGVRGAPGDLADGEFGRRGGFGLRGARWGGELGLIGADFRGARGSYTALTAGATVTARRVLVRRPLDRVFEQRLEVHARLGPSYTWMYGDPGEGPPDGASGAGFTAGAGLRWTFGAVALAVDLGLVEVRARRAAVFAPRDESGVPVEPAIEVRGRFTTLTFGLGFAL